MRQRVRCAALAWRRLCLLDRDGALMKQFGVRALPTTIFVGGDRKIREVHEGVEEYLEFTVDNLLRPDHGGKALGFDIDLVGKK